MDDQTSRDLDLGDFFLRYNKTITSFGDQLFYHMLHSQPRSLSESRAVVNDLDLMAGMPETVPILQKSLSRMGKQTRGNVVSDLWEGLLYKPALGKAIPFWFCSS